jgi:acetyl-CoA acetyltransferase family protein
MTTLEQLNKLPNLFSPEGPTTAGSASGIVDGACSILVASKSFVEKHNLKPIGKIRSYATVGVNPAIMGIGPVPAINAALGAINLKVSDVDLFEINEAFGAQCVSVAKTLEIDQNKLNIHGGAIAIGHPLAATGLRLVLTCLRALKKTDKKIGVASACIGGGQGIAMVIERVS